MSVNNGQMTFAGKKGRSFDAIPFTHQTITGYFGYDISEWLEQGDVDLAFDATVEMDASLFALFGAACRYQSDRTNCAFILQSDGKYTIRRFVNDNVTRLVDVAPSKAIHSGLVIDRVHAMCLGSQLRLWVNGTQLANLTDDQ
jgi:hypothetical protein